MLNDLSPKKNQIVFGDDSVVIQKYISGIKGGRTLDVTGFTEPVIKAGHVIIKLTNGNYAPMPVQEGNYAISLPSGAKFVGVLYRSIPTAKPAASIMTAGEVNSVAAPYDYSELPDFKAACPHIVIINDEEA